MKRFNVNEKVLGDFLFFDFFGKWVEESYEGVPDISQLSKKFIKHWSNERRRKYVEDYYEHAEETEKYVDYVFENSVGIMIELLGYTIECFYYHREDAYVFFTITEESSGEIKILQNLDMSSEEWEELEE